ncbi:hypothetical protein HD_1944 [[Haemophilus] ducreyi 35000HP]|uniref:Uncharacterized protein n=1 Tax=Haemophilus ducreyi (strain 35000HP / ATCC 700724) TaxID=233412 RepID=Q7VKG4_HAEDU|nr:hypothetical protein HD_1944 [[Haemophilus] ducreyi 35000HP]
MRKFYHFFCKYNRLAKQFTDRKQEFTSFIG